MKTNFNCSVTETHFLKNWSIFFCRVSCDALPIPPPARRRPVRCSLLLTASICIDHPCNKAHDTDSASSSAAVLVAGCSWVTLLKIGGFKLERGGNGGGNG